MAGTQTAGGGEPSSSSVRELAPEQLLNRCDPEQFEFETTASLEELDSPVGQPRAAAAIEFAVGMKHDGYNVFVVGPEGVGKRSLVRRILADECKKRPDAPDWCYVQNFDRPDRPRALRLPAGRGPKFARDMRQLVEDIQAALKSAFESEEYKTRRQVIEDEFNDRQEVELKKLNQHAEEKGRAVLRSPVGLIFAPVRDGEVLPKEEYLKLSDEEREQLDRETEELEQEFKELTEKVPEWERQRRERVRELNTEVTGSAVNRLLALLRGKYLDCEGVADYLTAVEADVIENAPAFVEEESSPQPPMGLPLEASLSGTGGLHRYEVNVLVDRPEDECGAPVVYEDNPTFQNLIGRIEHLSQLGNLVTDFRLIRAGALHRANGGYLIIDARKLLVQPFAWEALKRALTRRELLVESLGRALSLTSTITLEPEPIPLDVKVVLLGDRRLYYLLAHLDPEFDTLFKVQADFGDDIERTAESQELYARLIATVARRDDVRPLLPEAVARIIDEQAREVGDGERLSAQVSRTVDLVREADYFATRAERKEIAAADVEEAISAREHRADRIRQRMFEEVERGTVVIETSGERIGQINGCSVMSLGTFRFGRPTRISARVSLGKGRVVDIEREVELGGPIHSKGVMILAGFLAGRYAGDRPLALSGTLVFEQSYGGVEGDSASSAELLALLSAIGELPLRQSLAVTGAVDQYGGVQAVGGVNEKIEGMFELCQRRGLDGTQGVLLPAANVPHLMLRPQVIGAVREGAFHIYPISTIDQALELVTGVVAGERGEDGTYPAASANGRIDARLAAFAETLASFGTSEEKSE